MKGKDFKNISIRGRIAFVIMCFEKYVSINYPDRTWNRVSDFMWKLCDDSDYIDCTAYRYMEIIPEYLYEFHNYKDSDFDYLTEADYVYFTSIIPKNDPRLNIIMHAAYSIAMEYAYTALDTGAPLTYEYLDNVIEQLTQVDIPLPSIEMVSKYNFSESSGWGHTFNGRLISIILS